MAERKDKSYLSIQEARVQFANQRILMEVKERGERDEPLAGEILYHSKRGSPWRYLSKVIAGHSLDELRQVKRCFYVFAGDQPDLDPDKAFAQFIRFTNQLARETAKL